MNLSEFVGKRNINVTKLAEEIGYSRGHLESVLSGRLKMGKKLAKALEKISQDQMKAEELLKIYGKKGDDWNKKNVPSEETKPIVAQEKS